MILKGLMSSAKRQRQPSQIELEETKGPGPQGSGGNPEEQTRKPPTSASSRRSVKSDAKSEKVKNKKLGGKVDHD